MGEQRRWAIQLEEVTKHYRLGEREVRALNGVNLHVPSGSMTAIVGPSGSGKTTLLNLMGALDLPESGRVVIEGTDLSGLGERDLTQHRRSTVGFVFQQFNLIPNLSALENVALPMEFGGVVPVERQQRARELLQAVGLGDRLEHRPSRLSGGEQQRVAIARALANDPPIILADEPTGNLDTATGREIVQLLHRLVEERGKTVVVVTHDEAIREVADRSVTLRDGRILEEDRAAAGRPA